MKQVLFTVLCAGLSLFASSSYAQQSVSGDEAREIARDAYVYAYPLVMMEVGREVATNVPAPVGLLAPTNQFAHARAFPDAKFTLVVRPNADTLYSSLIYDVSKEPLIITVPDSGGRYYLLPLVDFWTDVFAVVGKRTTGTGPITFAIVGPKWHGVLPAGVTAYRSPTAQGWIGGRTQTNGKADYEAVHQFQAGIKAVPLNDYGKPYTPPAGVVNPHQDMSAPVNQVEKMDAATYFALFAKLMKENPPHQNDNPILDRMKRIGIEPGKDFSLSSAPPMIQEALNAARSEAQSQIKAAWQTAGVLHDGWRTNLTAIGTYGADYLHRAGVAYGAIGANVVEDAIYPTSFADSDGRPFDSSKRYVLHFDKDNIPPGRAFWSLTMYDSRQLFADNAIGRYAIGDRDHLKFNSDGSLDIYIQRESPGKALESNWLPAPAAGPFTMNLRLYWPELEAANGTWTPPGVTQVQ